MELRSSKVNEFRLWGLMITMAGMLFMIIGLAGIVFEWGIAGRILAIVFMFIGMISLLLSMGVYFWAGMLSTSAVVVKCPDCGKATKILGKQDRCMFCSSLLTVDMDTEPIDEKPRSPESKKS